MKIENLDNEELVVLAISGQSEDVETFLRKNNIHSTDNVTVHGVSVKGVNKRGIESCFRTVKLKFLDFYEKSFMNYRGKA